MPDSSTRDSTTYTELLELGSAWRILIKKLHQMLRRRRLQMPFMHNRKIIFPCNRIGDMRRRLLMHRANAGIQMFRDQGRML